jgi:hypothetical protein
MVSSPRSLYFFQCPDLSYPTLCALQMVSVLRLISFGVLTCPSCCALQEVSVPRSLGFFRHLDLSLPLCSLGSLGECFLFALFLLVS